MEPLRGNHCHRDRHENHHHHHDNLDKCYQCYDDDDDVEAKKNYEENEQSTITHAL